MLPKELRVGLNLDVVARRHRRLAGATAVTALVLFAAIAWGVFGSAVITGWEHDLLASIRARASPALVHFMTLVSAAHRPRGIVAATALALLVLLWRRERTAALWLLCTVGSGAALNHWVKHTVQRPRPGDAGLALASTDFSFPSGHVANATLLYGALALLVIARTPSRPWHAALALAALSIVALVAASRLVVSAHYPGDVAAGAALATGWLALCAGAWPGWNRRPGA